MGPPLPAGAGATDSIAKRPRITRPLRVIPASLLSLSEEWRFAIDPTSMGQTAGWFQPEFNDSPGLVVRVPHPRKTT